MFKIDCRHKTETNKIEDPENELGPKVEYRPMAKGSNICQNINVKFKKNTCNLQCKNLNNFRKKSITDSSAQHLTHLQQNSSFELNHTSCHLAIKGSPVPSTKHSYIRPKISSSSSITGVTGLLTHLTELNLEKSLSNLTTLTSMKSSGSGNSGTSNPSDNVKINSCHLRSSCHGNIHSSSSSAVSSFRPASHSFANNFASYKRNLGIYEQVNVTKQSLNRRLSGPSMSVGLNLEKTSTVGSKEMGQSRLQRNSTFYHRNPTHHQSSSSLYHPTSTTSMTGNGNKQKLSKKFSDDRPRPRHHAVRRYQKVGYSNSHLNLTSKLEFESQRNRKLKVSQSLRAPVGELSLDHNLKLGSGPTSPYNQVTLV